MPSQTPSQTIGPFFSFGLFAGGEETLVDDETLGQYIILTGQILDGNSEPVTDAVVEIWQADANGHFHHPRDPQHSRADPHFAGFGRSQTVNNGFYRFETVMPGAREGVPYINLRLFARGLLIHAVTRVYFADLPDNERDPAMQRVPQERRSTLLAQRIGKTQPIVYRFDIRLQGEKETVFFDC